MMLKKISALLLALAMVLVVAAPAFAALPPEGEGIEPQYVAMPCCGAPDSYAVRYRNIIDYSERVYQCGGSGMQSCSGDYAARYVSEKYCTACGTVHSRQTLQIGRYCPVAGRYYFA